MRRAPPNTACASIRCCSTGTSTARSSTRRRARSAGSKSCRSSRRCDLAKTRLIPVLYIQNGLIVRSEGFSIHQNIGNVVNQAHRYNEWDVDELIYIDISRHDSYDLRRDDLKVQSYSGIREIIERIASVCFMPLTFGGGIRTMD